MTNEAKVPHYLSRKLEVCERGMKMNFDSWKKTGLERYRQSYMYWYTEKERVLNQYNLPKMSDEEYTQLLVY